DSVVGIDHHARRLIGRGIDQVLRSAVAVEIPVICLAVSAGAVTTAGIGIARSAAESGDVVPATAERAAVVIVALFTIFENHAFVIARGGVTPLGAKHRTFAGHADPRPHGQRGDGARQSPIPVHNSPSLDLSDGVDTWAT